MLSLAAALVQAQPGVESAVEPVVELVPLELYLDDADPVVIDALRDGDRAFLPARAVFRYVGASYTEQASAGVIVVGTRRRVIMIGDSVRWADGSLYVDAAQVATLLRATVRVDWSELAVTITDDTLLPAARRRERALRIRQFNASPPMPDNWEEDDANAPSRPGAFEIDYGVVLSGQPDQWNGHQYFAMLGTTLFGGSLTTRVQSGAQTGVRGSETVWSLTQETHPIVRHLLIGDLPRLGLWGHRLLGVTLSNAPGGYSTAYDTLSINGGAPAGWEVDIERNGELIAGDSAVNGGRYAFRVPQPYGTTQYTIVMYGPEGEVRRVPYVVSVRDELVPGGRVYYAISAGWCSDRRCRYAADAQLRFSPVRRMTLISTFSRDVSSQTLLPAHGVALTESLFRTSISKPVIREPRQWNSISAVVQATHTLSVVGTSESGNVPQLLIQYVPSMDASLQMTWQHSALSYSGYWAGRLQTARTTIAIVGTVRPGASNVRSDTRFSAAVSGRFGRFAPFVQRRQFSRAESLASVTRPWTGGGDIWLPVRSLHFLRARVDGIGTAAGWSVEPGASVIFPCYVRLDVQARWQGGAGRPTTTWSIGKTVPFAALRTSVSTAPGVVPTTLQYVTGALRADPRNRRVILSPYSRIANAPLVPTLR